MKCQHPIRFLGLRINGLVAVHRSIGQMNTHQRPLTRYLRSDPGALKRLIEFVTAALTHLVEPVKSIPCHLLHRRHTGDHRHGISIEGPTMRQTATFFKDRHDAAPPRNGTDGETSTNNFTKCCQIGRHAVHALGAFVSQPKCDHFIENEHDVVRLAKIHEHFEISLRR